MDSKLIALSALLRGMGISDRIATLEDRKRVQKAIYLGQRAGVDLGYRFGWYLLGPYSPALAKDYFALQEARALGEVVPETVQLPERLAEHLTPLRPLMQADPQNVLDQASWLELLASVHYLCAYLRKDPRDARAYLDRQKPHLSEHMERATDALRSVGLLVT